MRRLSRERRASAKRVAHLGHSRNREGREGAGRVASLPHGRGSDPAHQKRLPAILCPLRSSLGSQAATRLLPLADGAPFADEPRGLAPGDVPAPGAALGFRTGPRPFSPLVDGAASADEPLGLAPGNVPAADVSLTFAARPCPFVPLADGAPSPFVWAAPTSRRAAARQDWLAAPRSLCSLRGMTSALWRAQRALTAAGAMPAAACETRPVRRRDAPEATSSVPWIRGLPRSAAGECCLNSSRGRVRMGTVRETELVEAELATLCNGRKPRIYRRHRQKWICQIPVRFVRVAVT
jgi:hypothetical protein